MFFNLFIMFLRNVLSQFFIVKCFMSLAIKGSHLNSHLFVLGGLGFSTDQIGTALLCVAAPLLFLQMWLFPKVKFEKRRLLSAIGSLSNDDRNGNKNVNRKYLFISFVLLHDISTCSTFTKWRTIQEPNW